MMSFKCNKNLKSNKKKRKKLVGAELNPLLQPATRGQAWLPHISILIGESKENKETCKLSHAKGDGIHQAEALLATATEGEERRGQQQPVAMHANEGSSVVSGSLMKHIRMAGALCSAVGHLHIMMYGGLRRTALICPC